MSESILRRARKRLAKKLPDDAHDIKIGKWDQSPAIREEIQKLRDEYLNMRMHKSSINNLLLNRK